MGKIAALCLVSEKYLHWSKAQEATLKELEPSIVYRRVTEQELRVFPSATQYPEVTRLLFSNRPKEVLKLFQEGFDEVLFLGADVYFTASFLSVLNEYTGSALFTPHITAPMPLDGCYPTTMNVHATGQLNSDFVLWRKCDETIKFLEWQAAMMEVVCKDDIKNGHFFDQVYLSYAPYFMGSAVIFKHPGFNVAYWNLPQRRLNKGNVYRYYVNELIPLYCFQFSGFDEKRPYSLTKYSNRATLQTIEVFNLMQEFLACLKSFCPQQDSVQG